MKITAYQQILDGACGINNINGFEVEDSNYSWGDSLDLNTFKRKDLDQGGPLLFTSFANNKVCKEAYEILCRRFLKVYQSPLTPNRFHGPRHRFFFCVFDTSKELKNVR
jgi:hypothetical protein